MKLGAYDYVTKPFNFEELRLLLERASAHLKLTTENRLLREQVKSKHGFGPLVGHAPEMEKLYRIIAKAAHSTHPVLILGESGTGKELVARSIHYSGPFATSLSFRSIAVRWCPTLIESELFGYVRGAFTGAVRAKDGLLATAEGGTVFLDEVGELPVDLQAKLLRAIQEKEVRPVGGTRAIPINVRILAATNRDLDVAVQQGTFRRDLYFRLNVLTLRIPPLRERKQDIPLLIGNVLERINGSYRNATQRGGRRPAADAQATTGRATCANWRIAWNALARPVLFPPFTSPIYPPSCAMSELPAERWGRFPIRKSSPPLPNWRSKPSCTPSKLCRVTSWRPRAGWASAKPRFTAN